VSAKSPMNFSEGVRLDERLGLIWSDRSPDVNFGRLLADRCSTPIWWRNARFSSSMTARDRKIECNVERSVARRIIIGGKNYRTNYKSRPLRHFEVFERHRQLQNSLNPMFADIAIVHAGLLQTAIAPNARIAACPKKSKETRVDCPRRTDWKP
jgi:hypothetical protein